jgi:hypothetical protein
VEGSWCGNIEVVSMHLTGVTKENFGQDSQYLSQIPQALPEATPACLATYIEDYMAFLDVTLYSL